MIFLFPKWDMLVPWRICFSFKEIIVPQGCFESFAIEENAGKAVPEGF